MKIGTDHSEKPRKVEEIRRSYRRTRKANTEFTQKNAKRNKLENQKRKTEGAREGQQERRGGS